MPFVITDLEYKLIPDQSDEHVSSGCEIECITNLDEILENEVKPIIEKRWFEKKLILKSNSRIYDIGCLHVEQDDESGTIRLQVFYTKEIYDMFLPIILNVYYGTKIYSELMQRHRDEQIGRLFE